MASLATNSPTGWPATLRAAIIAAAVALLYACAASPTTLFDRDEPRFAQATVEMLDSGNWLYPTFSGELRPDKPILIYWLMAGCVQLFGGVEWAFRLPSAVGVGIATFATFAAARRFLNERAALLAMLILASSPLAMMIGTAATADGWLLGMTTAALACFAGAVTTPTRARRNALLVMLAIFCGLAQLTKGPVALAIVGFPVLGVCVFNRTQARGMLWPSALALAGSAVIFLAWAVPANLATQGEFAQRGIGTHVISRMLAPMEGHGGRFLLSLPYYIPVVLAGFFPWAALLPSSIRQLFRRRGDAPPLLLPFVLWASVPLLALMSLVATKLPHYVLPTWPVLAIAVAHAADHVHELPRGWRITAAILFCGSAAVGAAGLLALPYFVPGTLGPCAFAAALLIGVGVAGVILARDGQSHFAAILCAVAMLAIQQIVAHGMLAGIDDLKLPPRVAGIIRAETPGTVPVLAIRFGEPSLVFYLWPQRVQIEGALEAIDSWKLGTEPSILIAPKSEYESRRHLPTSAAAFRHIATVEGFNYSSGDELTLVVVGRNLEAAR